MIAAGLIEPTAGEVWIDGNLATYVTPQQRGIGVVFQNYALFPHLTVFENIAFPLRMRKMPAEQIRKEVTRILEVVQLPHTADRFPGNLSGGQQQRIAFARCTVYRPAIILMDEPLGALDRKLRDQMQSEMKYLHRQLGITVLHITHDQDEAMAMSDRIGVLNNGKIEQIGTPSELYFSPKSLFVADFLGESNILDCQIIETATMATLRGPGDIVLTAPVNETHATGEKVKIVVRPESMEVLEPGETRANVVAGILREIAFVGGIHRCVVGLPGDVTAISKAFSSTGQFPHGVGDRVQLGWNAEQTIVLPSEPEP
jgi:putative spermidine/putrescine transport system ATP-binding protein